MLDNHIYDSIRKGRKMRIEHIALNVPDPDTMAAWYVANLQMQIIRQTAPIF
jgi:catechol-2,3-dioxygenase